MSELMEHGNRAMIRCVHFELYIEEDVGAIDDLISHLQVMKKSLEHRRPNVIPDAKPAFGDRRSREALLAVARQVLREDDAVFRALA
ncbi:MAG: hypothetical protein ACREB9_08780 [Thermoplasmata archaeon]